MTFAIINFSLFIIFFIYSVKMMLLIVMIKRRKLNWIECFSIVCKIVMFSFFSLFFQMLFLIHSNFYFIQFMFSFNLAIRFFIAFKKYSVEIHVISFDLLFSWWNQTFFKILINNIYFSLFHFDVEFVFFIKIRYEIDIFIGWW